MSERPNGQLFVGLKTDKHGNISGKIAKRFGHMKTAMGFGRDVVLHSIRKTVATLLENAGVPENVAADILGHEKPTMTYWPLQWRRIDGDEGTKQSPSCAYPTAP